MLPLAEEVKPEVSLEEKAHVKRLLKRIKSFESELHERSKGWETARNYADGDPNGDDEKGLVRVNLVGSMLETVQPAIYAKAPEIAVTLDETITTSNYPAIKKFATTLQSALNVFLVKDAKLKLRGKAAVRATLTATIGWVKVIYQKDRQDDPIIRNRINDTQDNIERLQALIEETREEGGECNEYEAKLFEMQSQVTSLEHQVEIVSAEGLVVDTLQPDDVIVLDASCRDIDEFMQASAIAHRIKMTVGAFKAQFRINPPSSSKKYSMGGKSEKAEGAITLDDDDYIVHVYEVWSMNDMKVYTLCEGSERYVREPYCPESLGAQWYPFFGLQLRRVDGKKYPKSMVEQLIELQDEYNTRRTNASEHRKKNIPVRIVNKAAGITDAEITAICNRSIKTDVIGVTTDTGRSLNDALGTLAEIPFNPQMYDTADIMRDMEMVGNVQDASRGAINKAKTATEAEIMSMGMQTRTSEALDVVEDWLSDIAIYSAQLLLQECPASMIQKRFGEEAVWPELAKKEVFEMIHISIRSGSTARPNKMRERDQWIQLLPLIQDAMQKVTEFKQAGAHDLAEAIIKLLDETLKRFDERLNAKELLGLGNEEGEEGQPPAPQGIPPEVQAQIQQAQEEVQAAMQQVDEQRGQIEKEAQAVQMERIQQSADNKVAKAEANAMLEKIRSQAAAAAMSAKEQVSSMLSSHLASVQSMVASTEQAEPDKAEDNSAQLAAVVADMNVQLQQQIAGVMEALANTNALLSAPKQVTTPSGEKYTMDLMQKV